MFARGLFAPVLHASRECRPSNMWRPQIFESRLLKSPTRTKHISAYANSPSARAIAIPAITKESSLLWAVKVGGIMSFAVGLSLWNHPKVECQGSPVPPPSFSSTPPSEDLLPPPPQSSVNLYELSFGTVCGVCAGVFIKKGAKALAFVLGGMFVLLQYFGSLSVIHVDWGRLSTRFEDMFYTTDAAGMKKPPTIYSLWYWLVNFLTADFQPRASFLAGLVLGLRIG